MITLPTSDDLATLWGDEADDIDVDRANLLIGLAGNLLWLATGITTDPTDPQLLNLIKYAICDMAIYLYVTRDDIDASYSPFQSERVGSYSYSKTYMALSKTLARSNGSSDTGVPLFDSLVAELMDELVYGGGVNATSGQYVYREQYLPLRFEAYDTLREWDADSYPMLR